MAQIFQEAKIGAKCPQLSFALQHQEMVGSPLQATPDLGAQRPDKVRRSRHGPRRIGWQLQQVPVAIEICLQRAAGRLKF